MLEVRIYHKRRRMR